MGRKAEHWFHSMYFMVLGHRIRYTCTDKHFVEGERKEEIKIRSCKLVTRILIVRLITGLLSNCICQTYSFEKKSEIYARRRNEKIIVNCISPQLMNCFCFEEEKHASILGNGKVPSSYVHRKLYHLGQCFSTLGHFH